MDTAAAEVEPTLGRLSAEAAKAAKRLGEHIRQILGPTCPPILILGEGVSLEVHRPSVEAKLDRIIELLEDEHAHRRRSRCA